MPDFVLWSGTFCLAYLKDGAFEMWSVGNRRRLHMGGSDSLTNSLIYFPNRIIDFQPSRVEFASGRHAGRTVSLELPSQTEISKINDIKIALAHICTKNDDGTSESNYMSPPNRHKSLTLPFLSHKHTHTHAHAATPISVISYQHKSCTECNGNGK